MQKKSIVKPFILLTAFFLLIAGPAWAGALQDGAFDSGVLTGPWYIEDTQTCAKSTSPDIVAEEALYLNALRFTIRETDCLIEELYVKQDNVTIGADQDEIVFDYRMKKSPATGIPEMSLIMRIDGTDLTPPIVAGTGTVSWTQASAAIPEDFRGGDHTIRIKVISQSIDGDNIETGFIYVDNIVIKASGPTLTLQKDAAGTGTGTVVSDPSGINCGLDCPEASASFPQDSIVTLTAAAHPTTSNFDSWTNCTPDGVDPNKCTVTMNEAKTVTAKFIEKTKYALTVNKDGSTGTGSVTSDPAGINCDLSNTDCTEEYYDGLPVKLTAVPNDDSTFDSWTNCTPDVLDPKQCTVTMDEAKTITAKFTAKPTYTLTVTRTGTGTGTVTGAGINCGNDCTETLYSGQQILLTAAANNDSDFTGWSGGECSGTEPCTVTVTADTTVQAAFTLKPKYALTVSKIGAGTGKVTSSPAGINCGTDCTEDYMSGTPVTLSNTPDFNSYFVGWSGACTSTPCQVSMTQARSVSADFQLRGDVDKNGKVELNDAVLVLKVMAGTGTITHKEADVDRDGVVELSDVIYIIQVVMQQR
jgi:hypothetical protein